MSDEQDLTDDELIDNAAVLFESIIDDSAASMTGFKKFVQAWLSAYKQRKEAI
jgi:hypothetical protein